MNRDRFKDAMSQLANGVSILTCRDGDKNYGITISSLTSIGIDPPTIAVCVEGKSALIEVIRRCRVFAITVLSETQKEIGICFADSSIPYAERFDSAPYEMRENCPLIKGGLVELICDLDREVDIAQNIVFFGKIRSGTLQEGKPLIYFDRNWQKLS